MSLFRIKEQFKDNNFQFVIDVEFYLDSFITYIGFTEDIIEDKVNKRIQELKKIKEDDELYYEEHTIMENIQDLYYSSLFINLYSFLERKLYQLCKTCENDNNLKVKDISGKGIIQYRKYLEKVVGLNFDNQNTEWSNILKFNELRNWMVHTSTNEIEKNGNNQKLINTIKSIEGLKTIEAENSIIIRIESKEFLKKFVIIIRKFLTDIYYTENENE